MAFWRLPRYRPALALNVALAVVALVAGWLAYRTVTAPGTTTTRTAGGQRTAQVTTGTVTATVSASGTIASAHVNEANFSTGGTVTEVDVAVGATVTKGQVLAKVDPSAAKDALAVAKADLGAAQAALAQAQASTTAASATISTDESQVASAQATVDTDQAAVDGTVLTAPAAGTVTAVNGSVGNAVSGTDSTTTSGFVEVSDLTALQAAASFAETDATKLKVGQAASITWSALTGATATGKVASISPTPTTSNSINTYPVAVSIDTPPDGIRLGETITVEVTVASASAVLRVPANAVRGAGGGHTVRVVSGGQTRTVTVQVGVQGNSYDEITGGLQEGEQVVLNQTTSGSTGSSNQNGFPGDGGGPPGGLAGGGG